MAEAPILRTERLFLRSFQESDLEEYAALYEDREVLRYLAGGPAPWDRSRSWRHLAFVRGHWQLKGTGVWAIEHRETGALVGSVGFWEPEGWPGFELAWTLARRFWGQGFATESARAALDHAFAVWRKDLVISLIHPENLASVRVAERLGESLVGRIPHGGREMLVYGTHRARPTARIAFAVAAAPVLSFPQVRLEEWLRAQAIWIEIKSMTPKARRDKVRLTRSLHTLGFLEVLLEAGASASAVESEEVFFLGLLAAQQLPSPRVSVELKNDLCAECCAEIANARRRLAKWSAARDALKKGNEYVERGSRSGVVEGKVLCVEAALEDDLGNFGEAAAILRRAIGLFAPEGQTFLISRTLAQLAYILADYDPAESLRAIGESLSLLQDDYPRLVVYLEILRMNCLVTVGAPQEALKRLNKRKIFFEQFREPYIQLRSRYTAARILEHLGQPKRAETLFQEVIAGDLEHGLVKDFFLDLVYLFGFYLKQGQPTDAIAVCRRAGQELSLLDDEEGSVEIARDQMRSVWRSLEQEVKRGTVDLKSTVVLRNYIRAHWRFPAGDLPSFARQATEEK